MNSNDQAKIIIMKLNELVKRVDEGSDRYLIAKVIDLYMELPSRYQKAFIDYFCAELPNERWTKCQNDDTLYLGALRAITLHFTGLEKANQPTLGDLMKHLTAFTKSDFWRKANVIIKTPKKPFAESLKEL